jgi:hypothetical protein
MLFLQKHFLKILLLVSAAVLSPYFYLSLFANPIADDYHYSLFGMRNDLWNEWLSQYLGRNGRYTSNILMLMNPMSFHNISIYKLMPAVQIMATVISIYYFFRAASQRFFSSTEIWIASLLFLLLYLFCMPSLAEGIYWYTGAASYQSGICITMLYFGSVCDYFNGKYFINKQLHLFVSACLLLASTGFNEALTLLIVSFHIAVTGLLWINRKTISAEWWILIATGLAGACFLVFSPGNFVRDSNYTEHHHLIRSLVYTSLQIVRFAFDWISNLPFIFSTFLLIFISVRYKEKFSLLRKLEFLHPALLLVFLPVILFICIFPAYWETNILGQQRTANTACFFFMLLWFTGIPANANKFSERFGLKNSVDIKSRMILVFLVLLSMAATRNGYGIFLDLFYGKTQGYDREMNWRYKILSDPANKGKTVYFKPLDNKPRSLFVLDFSTDPIEWVNRDPTAYFGVEKIICNP